MASSDSLAASFRASVGVAWLLSAFSIAENMIVQPFEKPGSFGHSFPVAMVCSSCPNHAACSPWAAATTCFATDCRLGKLVKSWKFSFCDSGPTENLINSTAASFFFDTLFSAIACEIAHEIACLLRMYGAVDHFPTTLDVAGLESVAY